MFSEESIFDAFPYRGRAVFVDVGANVGTFAAIFAKRGLQVIAFEPHPALFAALAQRFNDDRHVLCVQKAISDEPGRLPFYTSNEHPGIHSLAPFDPTHEPTETVEVSTLSEELRALRVGDITALKIDVEGADFLALRGFDWDSARPELVMVEFMDSRSTEHFGYTHHDMAKFMKGKGYDTWVSEWAPLTEYRKAGDETPHRWMGFHAYDAHASPAHGNLLFVQPTDSPKLQRTVNRVSRLASARDAIRSIPGLRGAVRASRAIWLRTMQR
jgi:FkbM family methyltransferase